MKRILSHLLLFYFFCLGVNAQVGKVGINTTAPAAMLHVKDSSVVFTGAAVPGSFPGLPPVTGPGVRMMWYTDKAAFRAGAAFGQEWNRDSTGTFSVAMGYKSRASGSNSLSIGNNVKADGHFSISMGVNNIATGQQSTAIGSFLTSSANWSTSLGVGNTASGLASLAMGSNNFASGFNSTAIGYTSKASGDYATVIGYGCLAKSYATVAIGQYNDTTTTESNFWDPLDPIFVVGNGSNSINRSNAITVLKNGKVGIGTSSPQNLFHISGGDSEGTTDPNSVAVFEDDNNVSINLLTPNGYAKSIFFGSPDSPTHGGILYSSNVPDGLEFRTNLTQRAVINDIGNFGIGESTPNARLHVSNGLGGNLYHSAADLIIEDNSQAYIQFSTATASTSGLLAGNAVTDIRSAILFMADSTVQIRSGGNDINLTIDKSGNTNTAGEIRRTSTGDANLVPICYGSVDAAGTILSGSGNFSVTTTPPGFYEITITGETYTNSGYTTSATPVSSNPRFLSTGNSGGKIVVRTFTSASALVDTLFHFVVYKN